MAASARKTQYQVVHEISKTFSYSEAGLAAGLEIGKLPAGAVIDKTTVLTTTAWNGSVSVDLSVGFTATGTELINGTDVRTGTARVDTVAPIANAGPRASDTTVYGSVAFGGTAGSAGSTTVVVTYITAVG